MGKWKEEDLASPEFIEDYLQEFREGITNNARYQLSEPEKLKVQDSLAATKNFCLELLTGKKGKLYMHDLILMAIGFYGGYLTALDCRTNEKKPQNQN
jgi:hypothetical protein